MEQKKRVCYIAYITLAVLLGYLGIHAYHIRHNTAKESSKQSQSNTAEAESAEEKETVEDVKPKLALTFDDGPHPVFTARLLDGLKERGIHATFFVIGKNISGNEDVIKRMYEEGHLIGNHTYDHVKITGMKEEEAYRQIISTSDAVQEITGIPTEYVRAPFGTWTSSLESDVSMFPVKWTIDPKDWTTANVDQIVQKVVKNVKENDIILMHDYYDSSVEAALRIIDILMEQGYVFVTVDEIILE